MSTVTHGGDVDALIATARAYAAGAEQIRTICVRITVGLCHTMIWNGPDALAARTAWEHEWSPALMRASGALVDAGLELVGQAEDQLRASGADTAGSGSGAGVAGATTAAGVSGAAGPGDGDAGTAVPGRFGDLRTNLERLRSFAMSLPELALQARALRTFGAVANNLATADVAREFVEAGLTGAERVGLDGLSVVGTVLDADGFVTGIEERDVTAIVQNGTSLGITAAAPWIGSAVSGGVGVAWGVGSLAGDMIYDGIQGTRYNEILTEMTDGAFRDNGALGIAQVPGLLAFAAWEALTEDDTGE
ncbi:hypothetical protein EXU48_15070 [Occultella glacieicola]|uniref:WXG100 family type VII secretion target n=1 Tax=Occultella glacieicola TaxID=2518684 RepID=A0ABY2E0L8_9MICO|nr:hypothetical protein [Occultella glacieicola]TDE91478.1 hypothetical protein EXU48_15070 [Occultella glacieicola]